MPKSSLYDNIRKKRERIAKGSGERMRKPGTKGAPTAQNFKDAAKNSKELNMAMKDASGYDAPASNAFAVTPADGSNLTHAARALFVGGAGDIKSRYVGRRYSNLYWCCGWFYLTCTHLKSVLN